MKIHLKKVEKDNIMWMVDALLTLGAVDIHIVDNTHLEGGQWEISFVNYNMVDLNNSKKTMEQLVWDEVMRRVENGE